ncbi:hypothetical protein ASE92_11835 [Pedobacter sp. Leaf41]|nr:hypothetical protein ASE92_11835 [Pedobacter sp. Leaf41]
MESKDLTDIYSAISIILVFITIILDLIIRETQIFDQKKKPDSSKATEITLYNRERIRLLFKIASVFLFYLFTFYLLLPNSIKIFNVSTISFWEFDLLSTFYLFINISLLVFIYIIIVNFIKIYRKR